MSKYVMGLPNKGVVPISEGTIGALVKALGEKAKYTMSGLDVARWNEGLPPKMVMVDHPLCGEITLHYAED